LASAKENLLTDIQIGNFKPGPKPKRHKDGDGLFLLVTPSGRSGSLQP